METRLTKYQDVEDAVIIDQPEEKKAFILWNTRGIELQNLQDDYLVWLRVLLNRLANTF